MYAAMPYKQLRETNHQQTQNHCMMDFQFFHEDYILPLSETYVTSTNSSVFFNTGKRSASGEKKTIKLSLVTGTQSGKTEFNQLLDILSFKWTTTVNKALKNWAPVNLFCTHSMKSFGKMVFKKGAENKKAN